MNPPAMKQRTLKQDTSGDATITILFHFFLTAVVVAPARGARRGRNPMKTNTKKINIATIILLALTAVSTSPRAISQIIVFITLLTVVFERDFLLKKLNVLKS